MAPPSSPLNSDSSTLAPLPTDLRHGLIAITVVAFVSFSSTTTLFLYLTYKLIKWHVRSWRASTRRKGGRTVAPHAVSLPGINNWDFLGEENPQPTPDDAPKSDPEPELQEVVKHHPNQFVLLIYNLLLADMHQATAFLLNTVWVHDNAIEVGTRACWLQGFFVSTGDLASSCFITFIAIHTYLTVVRAYKPPQWNINLAVVCIWTFVYLMMAIGVGATRNGRDAGGFYVRATAWCWINQSYEGLRLFTHYLFIFIGIFTTTFSYVAIFLHLKWRTNITREERAAPSNQDVRLTGSAAGHLRAASGDHPGFLVYPIIYVVCTLPLAVGRAATMAGKTPPLTFFAAAGFLIVSNGWLDALLWGFTRRKAIFGPVDDEDALGLNTFTFRRHANGRLYGNAVWIEAAPTASQGEQRPVSGSLWGRLSSLVWKGRPSVQRSFRGGQKLGDGTDRSISQVSLHDHENSSNRGDMAIQMDMVTTVVVEQRAGRGAPNP